MLRSLLVALLLVSACSAGAPASPSPAPPTGGPTPAPTVAPTTAPTPTGTAYCNPDYYDCDHYSPSPPATAGPGGAATVSLSEDGAHLVGGPNGFVLYVFDNDPEGGNVSMCSGGGCAGAWPALTVTEGAAPTAGDGVTGTLTTFDRGGGVMQVAYDGRPLYNYGGDSSPTDTNGDGINDVWHLATP